MKALMKWSIRILVIIVVFLIIGSILMSTKIYEKIFWSPLCFLLLGIFTVITAVCSFKQGFKIKKIGFQLCHLGIVVIMFGACIGYFSSVKSVAAFPMNVPFTQFQLEDNSVIDLDFSVSVIDFQVTRYDPDYYLLRALNGNTKSNDIKDFENLGVFKQQFDGSYNLKEYGIVGSDELKDSGARDGWRDRLELKNDLVLIKDTPKDKHYLAKIMFVDANGREIIESLEVNKPVDYSGWRFYLNSYDRDMNSYVVLTAKRDPGTIFVIYGIWAVLIGTVILCFGKRNYLQGGNNNAQY